MGRDQTAVGGTRETGTGVSNFVSSATPALTRRPTTFLATLAGRIAAGVLALVFSGAAQAQRFDLQIPLSPFRLQVPQTSDLIDLNVLYDPRVSEEMRREMQFAWTGDERIDGPWLAKVAAGQVLADHARLLAIQGLQTTNMADVASAGLIESIDIVRGYRLSRNERGALRRQLMVSLLDNGAWRSSDFRSKQVRAERLAYWTLFLREMAEQAVQARDVDLAAALRARTRQQVIELFRIDLDRAQFDENEGLKRR